MLAATFVAPLAHGADKAAAEALFQEGRALLAEGKTAEACAKLEASLAAEKASGTALNLARCYEKLGKPATAWAQFVEARHLASVDGYPDREAEARRRIKALEPKLSRLTVVVARPVPGLIVRRNGEVMAEGSLGTPIPVDPGRHDIEASAPGYLSVSTAVEIDATPTQRAVELPALLPAPDEAGASPAVGADEASNAGPSATLVAGAVLTTLGGAGLVVGAALGGVAMGELSEVEDDAALCPDKICTAAGRDQVSGAERLAHGSTVGFVVGGALLVTGVVLLLLAEPEPEGDAEQAEPMARARVIPWVGAHGAGATVGGSF